MDFIPFQNLSPTSAQLDMDRKFIKMNKIKNILILSLALILNSCHFMNDVSDKKMQKISEEPSLEMIEGNWEIDSFSYNFIKESIDLKERKIVLGLEKDMTFSVINYPVFNSSGFVKDSTLNSHQGKWRFKKSYDKKSINIIFEEFNQDKIVWSKEFVIYDKKDTSLVLWKFIDDPDSGHRMMFEEISDK